MQSGCRWIIAVAAAQGLRLRRDGRRTSARSCPSSSGRSSSTRPTGRSSPRAPATPATSRRTATSSTSTTRSTSSTRAAPPASPRARRSPTTTSSTTATSSAAMLGYTERDRVCIPVPLYHCFGMVLGNLAATSHGACMVYPAETFDPLATLEACANERCTSLYGVPTMFIAELGHERFDEFDLGPLRTGIMAGSPCPIEVMKRVSDKMGIEEMSIAFGMTETSPVTTQVRCDDTLENRCGTVGEVGPHVEIKIVDPGQPGRTVAARRARRVPRARLRRHARLLERPRAHRRVDRRAALDAHRRPRDDGRAGLRAHRRPDQGHGDPRRRERLPARDRGVPLHPSGHRRRAGDRRARRALRRGADGVGDPAPRRDR